MNLTDIDFTKNHGLVPAIIVDSDTQNVLMLGYMNEQALAKTKNEGKVTFYSRSKKRLWTKGETSGNFLLVDEISTDCDKDALLITVYPQGPTCHTGAESCFQVKSQKKYAFLAYLFKLISRRKVELPDNSYTTRLFKSGPDKIIQKVGEEAVETVIAAKNRDREEIINETSDLIFHLFVMLNEQNIDFQEVVDNLNTRHN